ncbi:MAG: hypothetical protein WC547_06680 [Candidatus Omnitrophota bacterium]
MGIVLCTMVSGCTADGVFAQGSGWQNISHEIIAGNCVQEDPANPLIIYFGTAKGLYKTEDAGSNWKNILRDRDMAINHILINPSHAAHVFAGTSKGVYASRDGGLTWKNIFRSSNEYEANCRAIIARSPLLYAGTDQGLFVSTDSGVRWNKESGALGKSSIVSIAADGTNDGHIYAAARDGVYRKKASASRWEKVFEARGTESDQEQDIRSDQADVNNDDPAGRIRSLCVDPAQPGTVYLATASGVFSSRDSAVTWEKLTEFGLSSHDVRMVAVGNGSRLYAATGSDVFMYSSERWHRTGSGITARTIQGIAGGTDQLYAATDAGLYSIAYIKHESEPSPDSGDFYTGGLPPIAAVQRAAIAYADADIGKIHQWRRQARNAAFLPTFDVGINNDATDLWHWEGGSTTKEYDDILRKGKGSYEWDISLKWNLGELIWNDAQTSIDTRSRLLVQLRDDILDEVTKLYFEYVRVRMGMDSLSVMDKKKLIEKEVRLKELSAQLDGLTGNFFSRTE